MPEYDIWYEVWAEGDFEWVFIADFASRYQAEEYASTSSVMDDYHDYEIRKCMGQG